MWDSEDYVDQLIRDHDDTSMPLPNIELEPHLLISKVRKHYMEYLIKLLSSNYESNQRLVDKNIYLPSAIWRCAKILETKAAQACMVVQLYRRNLLEAINELKKDTNNGKLNRMLYECLRQPPNNEKKLQTMDNNTQECPCRGARAKRKISQHMTESLIPQPKSQTHKVPKRPKINDCPPPTAPHCDTAHDNTVLPTLPTNTDMSKELQHKLPKTLETAAILADSQSQDSDELMIQLEKLFQAEPNDDDLFDSAFGDAECVKDNYVRNENGACDRSMEQTKMMESHAVQIRSLDERLASMAALLMNSSENEPSQIPQNTITQKPKKLSISKWYCEEYYLKCRFFELLDQIGMYNRKKLQKIKVKLVELFGDDSDEEGVISPLEESTEMMISCKERIAPWVVKVLTPYYIKGRIKGKALFKVLAKHLIRLIYQCSHYPCELDVHKFVKDFLKTHKTIHCEADFLQFKIDNI